MAELFQPSSFDDHQKELDFLKSLGFATNPLNKSVSSVEAAMNFAKEIEAEREKLDYNIDGVVVKIKDNKLANILGVVGKTSRAWAAIKFAATEVVTRVVDIVWQVGRTGKLTPVAILEPVLLDGSTVGRATFHNMAEVRESDIHKLDSIILRKAGDIIPEVVKVLTNLRITGSKQFVIPDICPDCKSELVTTETGIDLICPNTDGCRSQIISRLSYFTGRSLANIQGLSEKTIEKLNEIVGVKDIADLYDIDYNEIIGRESFGAKSVENMVKAIDTARTLPDYKFLAGLGIDGVGPEVAKLVCGELKNKKYW